MDRQLAIGYLLFIGVLVCFVIIFTGGSLYLMHHGSELVHYQVFHEEAESFKSIPIILQHASSFSALALIQVGLLCLVILQLLRVALITWFFIRLRDKLFALISFFILSVLIYSLVWHS